MSQARRFLLLCVALLVIACGRSAGEPPAAVQVPTATLQPAPQATNTAAPVRERVPLVVFAAGSLIIPFDALEKAFEERHPEIDVQA